MVSLVSSAAGDGDLDAMYSPVGIGEDSLQNYLDKAIRKRANDLKLKADDEKVNLIKQLALDELSKFPAALSIHEAESGQKSLGLYYNTQLHKKFPPYFRVFGGADSKIGGDLKRQSLVFGDHIKTVRDYRSSIMNYSQLEILDLNDAYVEIDDLSTVARVSSLKFLALPSRGMRYNKQFSFPENIKVLVVRNAELTPQFFEAAKKIRSLECLIIDECNIRENYNWPTLDEWYQLRDSKVEISDRKNPFDDIAKNLRTLQIVESDPALVENFNLLKWPSLNKLSVDIFLDSDFLRGNLAKNSAEFRQAFPSLKEIKLRLYDKRLSQNLIDIVKGHEIEDLKVEVLEMNPFTKQ